MWTRVGTHRVTELCPHSPHPTAGAALAASAMGAPSRAALFAGGPALGEALMLVFFATLGASANVADAVRVGGAVGLFVALQLGLHLAITLALGWLCRLPLRLVRGDALCVPPRGPAPAFAGGACLCGWEPTRLLRQDLKQYALRRVTNSTGAGGEQRERRRARNCGGDGVVEGLAGPRAARGPDGLHRVCGRDAAGRLDGDVSQGAALVMAHFLRAKRARVTGRRHGWRRRRWTRQLLCA